jgi:23S rRNA U2552 (ribose-2'-O)-methylase RlmE/FtsJ
MSSALVSKYTPITLNMQIDMKSIFDSESNVKLTNNMDYPKCSFGFHHYMHSLKKDTLIIKDFENKKKVYLVTNPFELEIDKYENSIKNKIESELNIKDKIVSDDFYKLWEIMFMFDLFDTSDISCAHFLENGSNIQSIINFREKYYKTKDKHYLLKYENFKENKFLNETNKNISILNGTDSIKEKVELITIGSSVTYENDNENTIESEYHIPLLKNIINSVKIQKKGGSLVIKVFETYTDVTAKILSILISLYDKVFITKPMTSKPSQTEKYIVCSGFKLSDSSGVLKKLEKIEEVINRNPKLKLSDLFMDYEIDFKLKIRLIKINQLISNLVFKSLGKIVNFINSQDYYGDTYEKYRDEQIDANKFWLDTFLPEAKNFKELKKKNNELSFLTNKMNVDDAIQLEKKIL